MTGAKSDDPIHIDYLPIVFASPRREKVLMVILNLKNLLETRRKKRKKRPSKQE